VSRKTRRVELQEEGQKRERGASGEYWIKYEFSPSVWFWHILGNFLLNCKFIKVLEDKKYDIE
jgi:hypothetical protein